MRRNFYGKVFIPLLAITLLFAHCKKGDTGATGPAGPAGQAGQAGLPGSQGPKGDTGTANVIYSAWLDVAFVPDTVHNGTVIDTFGFHADIPAVKLDSAMLTNGEIKVYFNLGSSTDPAIVPLPFLDPNLVINIVPVFSKQDIFIQATLLTTNVIDPGTFTPPGSNSKFQQYRYILIPGSVGTTRVMNLDWKDYNKVKAFFGLKD